jgi:glucokinase
MLLAGDVGGTSTRLGLFDRAPEGPRAICIETFRTLDFPDLAAIVVAFLDRAGRPAGAIEAACFGVAGPVTGRSARLTNVPWTIDAGTVAAGLSRRPVHLLNDLEAMAWSIPGLGAADLITLQEGEPAPEGHRALIAAGTGLGVALIPRIGGRWVPVSSEGGHADFGPRTPREIEIHRALTRRFGRAEGEQVVSGPGLVNIHEAVHATACTALPAGSNPDGRPPLITAAALQKRCPGCVEALAVFVSAYGAAAGNLALTAVATGGLYVGGGIAPKILPALQAPAFLEAFRAKAPMEHLMRRVPVRVILNPHAGLIGAAAFLASS